MAWGPLQGFLFVCTFHEMLMSHVLNKVNICNFYNSVSFRKLYKVLLIIQTKIINQSYLNIFTVIDPKYIYNRIGSKIAQFYSLHNFWTTTLWYRKSYKLHISWKEDFFGFLCRFMDSLLSKFQFQAFSVYVFNSLTVFKP